MTTIEKKVEIPENHRLLLDLALPTDIPPGVAEVTVTITPTTPKCTTGEALSRFAGTFADSAAFSRDPLEIQQELRSEW